MLLALSEVEGELFEFKIKITFLQMGPVKDISPLNRLHALLITFIIASRSIDEKHVLRVVYKWKGDIITVITFYPAAKGRYY